MCISWVDYLNVVDFLCELFDCSNKLWIFRVIDTMQLIYQRSWYSLRLSSDLRSKTCVDGAILSNPCTIVYYYVVYGEFAPVDCIIGDDQGLDFLLSMKKDHLATIRHENFEDCPLGVWHVRLIAWNEDGLVETNRSRRFSFASQNDWIIQKFSKVGVGLRSKNHTCEATWWLCHVLFNLNFRHLTV